MLALPAPEYAGMTFSYYGQTLAFPVQPGTLRRVFQHRARVRAHHAGKRETIVIYPFGVMEKVA